MSGKIKVLYSIPNFDTAGSGKALLNLAQSLDSEIFEPHIMCLHDRGDFFKVVESSGIPVHIIDYISPARPISRLFRECRKVGKQIKKIDPDVIHSFNYSADYTEALASKFAGAKWTFTKKNMSWGGASSNAWKLRSFLAKGIVVQNTDMIKQFYPKTNKTSLIPRGVDTQKFRSGDALESTDLSKTGKRVLITVANMVPVKGVELLIQAFGNLKELHTNWELWIIGDDSNQYGKELHDLTKNLNLDDYVFFSGKQSDVVSYLNHAEIFVLPTKDEGRREGSPVAILEAMANSKLVLGSDIPGIRDQLKAFPKHIFNAGDVQSLQDKLSFFMKLNSTSISEIGQQFNLHVNEHFKLQIEVDKHEEFYKKVLKS